jgi:prevent-host-death family protein
MPESHDPVTTEPTWQLQEAKARLSEIVRRAIEEGPQHVSVRGEPAAVIISEDEYRELTSKRPSIVDHILNGPAWPDDLVDAINERPAGSDRDIDL